MELIRHRHPRQAQAHLKGIQEDERTKT